MSFSLQMTKSSPAAIKLHEVSDHGEMMPDMCKYMYPYNILATVFRNVVYGSPLHVQPWTSK